MRTLLLAGTAALLMATSACAAADKCAIANPPWDGEPGNTGLLNLREKPDAKSKIRHQLEEGAILFFTGDPTLEYKNWIYVNSIGIKEEGGEVHIEDGSSWGGWVNRKYIVPTKCPSTPSLTVAPQLHLPEEKQMPRAIPTPTFMPSVLPPLGPPSPTMDEAPNWLKND